MIKLTSLGLIFISLSSVAQDMFPAGSEGKAAGHDSALYSRKEASLLVNPANLGYSSSREANIESGVVNIEQSYEHPDFDPVVVSVTTPFASMGATTSLWSDKFRIGLLLHPAKKVNLNVPGLPRRVASLNTSFNSTVNELQIKSALGVSYSVNKNLLLGASGVLRYEKRDVEAKLAGSDSTVLEAEAKGVFYQPVVGLSYNSERHNFSLSYRSSLIKNYEGTQVNAGGEESTIKTIDFEASMIGYGYELSLIENLKVGYSGSTQYWSEGRNIYRDGLSSTFQRADFKDIQIHSLSLGYTLNGINQIKVAYTLIPSHWGDGVYADEIDKQYLGADFGKVGNVDRRILSGSYSGVLSEKTDYFTALYFAQGERENSLSADHPGYFQLSMNIISAGINRKI